MTAKATKKVKGYKSFIGYLVLVAIVLGLGVLPLLTVKHADFGGADDKAKEAITEMNADYKPWFTPLFEPKSEEVESLLFALQAAIGAGIIGYGLGYMRGRKKREEESADDIH